ncbi:Scarecrow-like protein [Thalictrum thalictroides]|uniref:Scarecrow-like protein n=1 Tax=Thalictrum thalictroides TaxID=46969 RepID=A0A7J6VBU2_THATH|nr:Scarecrow-like protein [Thalictrum thalictroides]
MANFHRHLGQEASRFALTTTKVPACRPLVPPFLNVSTQEVGLRLANFVLSRNVPFEFHVIHGSSSSMPHDHILSPAFQPELLLSQLNATLLNLKNDEALVINCQNWLRYLPDEPEGHDQYISLRDRFLEIIKSLNPCIVVVVDEDANLTTPSLSSRITTSFKYLWIPFNALETFLPKDSNQEQNMKLMAKPTSLLSIMSIMEIMAQETGLNLNPHKTTLLTAGVTEAESHFLAQICGVRLVNKPPVTYLVNTRYTSFQEEWEAIFKRSRIKGMKGNVFNIFTCAAVY